MARFRGSVFNPHKGNATHATRLGHTGLEAAAYGWTGGARVTMSNRDGVDWVTVDLIGHPSKGGGAVTVYSGPATAEEREAAGRLVANTSQAAITVYHDIRKVLFKPEAIEAFNSQWPCSTLRAERAYWFQFERGGDLVDTDCPEQDDGPAALALSDDAKTLLEGGTPKWADDAGTRIHHTQWVAS